MKAEIAEKSDRQGLAELAGEVAYELEATRPERPPRLCAHCRARRSGPSTRRSKRSA